MNGLQSLATGHFHLQGKGALAAAVCTPSNSKSHTFELLANLVSKEVARTYRHILLIVCRHVAWPRRECVRAHQILHSRIALADALVKVVPWLSSKEPCC